MTYSLWFLLLNVVNWNGFPFIANVERSDETSHHGEADERRFIQKRDNELTVCHQPDNIMNSNLKIVPNKI